MNNENKLYLLTDIDDTVLDFNTHFRNWIQETKNHIIEQSSPHSYDLHTWLGVHPEVADKWVKEFNESDEFGTLSAIAGADTVLPKFTHNGYTVIGITSCGDSPRTQEMRWRNLEAVFPAVFSILICLPIGTNKEQTLRKFPSGIWCDDKLSQVQAGLSANHICYLKSSSHNLNFDTGPMINRFDHWSQLSNTYI